MRCMGAVGLAFAVVVASACGAAQSPRAAPVDHLQPAPPIEAIDEPAADRFFFPPEFSKGGEPVEKEVCLFIAERMGDPEAAPVDCNPSPEEIDAFRRLLWEDGAELMPTEPAAMRSIARLPLEERGPKDRALLAAWRTAAGKLCFATDVEDEEGLNGNRAVGPCLAGARCRDLCLERSGHYDYGDPPWLLSGIVNAAAEQLRIVLADGESLIYPLTGPVVPNFPTRRVFMLDLGNRSHRRLELLEGGKVIAHEDVLQSQVEGDRCVLQYGPEHEREFAACMRKAYGVVGGEGRADAIGGLD
jgi:hypothetical protein